MKISVSLSDLVGENLNETAERVEGASVSLLAELGIQRLLASPESQLAVMVRHHRLARRATARSGWTTAFWSILGDTMGRRDQIANPYAPRQYGSFILVMLMNRADGSEEETDPFPVRLWPENSTPQSQPPEQWIFPRTASPAIAAETVAAKLRHLGVHVSEMASSKDYAIEKFYTAVLGLTTGTDEIRGRLESAAIALHVLSAERDFPKELQQRFASLWDDLTREEANFQDEGRIQATIRHMKADRAVEIAERVFSLYFALLDITPLGNRRE